MSDKRQTGTSSAGRKRKRRRREESADPTGSVSSSPITSGLSGGRYSPLNPDDVVKIDVAVRDILQTIGMSEAPEIVVDTVTAAGGRISADGRLTYSAKLIEDALAGMQRNIVLHGQQAGHELHMTGKRVHMGTGGAAPRVLDLETDCYRESTLKDLYDAARLVDSLDNIHFFSRPMVARDMPSEHLLDINTAYASLTGTCKHVCVSVCSASHVADIAEMCHIIAGSKSAFAERPFLSILANHVVSPLRFDPESAEIMAEAARLGLPVHANTFGQLGASSPVTIAGCVAQTVAETLSGMIFAWLINPNTKMIFGTRPMITDLRTGAVSGGSGEQAVLMAATAQMAQFYDLPNSTIAGATDSKIADAQSGYEKCLTVSLAAQAGSNMITQSCGMQAMLMGVEFESYVIDNDMLGGILRSLNGIEVNEETLAMNDIHEVVHGDGHFLGQAQTLNRMNSDFLYPQIADRQTVDEWEAAGSVDIRQVAKEKTREILAGYTPAHLPADVDEQLRERFDIRLPR